MAWYRSSLLAKCRNSIASLTLAAAAMSLVLVPLNPLRAKVSIATLRSWRRRSSPCIFGARGVDVGLAGMQLIGD